MSALSYWTCERKSSPAVGLAVAPQRVLKGYQVTLPRKALADDVPVIHGRVVIHSSMGLESMAECVVDGEIADPSRDSVDDMHGVRHDPAADIFREVSSERGK